MSENSSNTLKLSTRLSLPLSYQQVLIHEIYDDDGLIILARGLGLLNIVANLLHSYNLPGCLTLVIGANGRQEELLKEMVDELAMSDNKIERKMFKIINNESGSADKRKLIYNKGGIFSVTSRILVVDLLTGIIDPVKISGIVALNAEKSNETSLEAFILKLFREKNRIGYIKAFSDNPEALSFGFFPLSDIMKTFFLKKCFLWPRFHVLVAESLESKKVDVIELDIPMTESMKDIQCAIIECIEICISGLKSANSGKIDVDNWNLENVLHKGFDKMIRRQLDLHWHRISQKTKQLVSDLETLRPESSSEIMKREQSPWLLLDAANTMFKLAKERVYKKVTSENISIQEPQISILPVLENQPKWFVLKQVMYEIEMEISLNPKLKESNDCMILIMCKSEYTCHQIQEYLRDFVSDGNSSDKADNNLNKSECSFLKVRFKEYLLWKQHFLNIKLDLNDNNTKLLTSNATSNNRINMVQQSRQFANKRRRMRGGSYSASNISIEYAHTFLKDDLNHNEVINNFCFQNEAIEFSKCSFDDNNDFKVFGLNDFIVISPYSDDMDDVTLKELKPKFIILYEPDPVIIRRIELYNSIYKNALLRVYFMYYGNSVEEQKYLASVRKEKDSFAALIKEKGNMALLLTQEGKNDESIESDFFKKTGTQIAKNINYMANEELPKLIVVNLGIHCLLFGDYILSPSLCVERKSLKDLVSSLNSGRLYTQCEMMQQYYSTPILLIEFDQNKTFNFEPFTEITSNINTNNLQSKLVLLTIAFPKLRIIWSSGFYATCDIFVELKKNHSEPDPVKAASLGLRDDEDNADFLLSIPKISLENYKNIIYNVRNICDLSNLEEKQIIDLIGPESGKAVYSFFNKTVF
ncbi:hypothetical protein PCANB_000445 [Pneumocystis canis]|nr:hypothetical protein PCANB_000445 [Pneumocystis canis]